MIFQDRIDAGKKLIPLLEEFRNSPNTIVLGLPRGGVILAHQIATNLNLPLDIICPRKIGAPHNPELAIGATTETGDSFFDPLLIKALNVSDEYITQQIEMEKKEAQRRKMDYRIGKEPLRLENKYVIIVDDGLATGSTMKAAIKSVKTLNAEKIFVAIPVSPITTLGEIEELVDKTFCLSTPANFMAVGQFYQDFKATEDQEVIELMK